MTQAAAIREMNKALAEIIREIDREIVKLAASLDTEGGALKADAFNLRNLVSMRQQMEEFADAKAPQLLREFRRNLPGIVEQVIAEYPDLGRFTPAIIEQLQDTFTDQITEMVQTLNKEVSDDLMRALRLSIVGSVEVPKMQANLAKSLAISELRVQALIERSVRDFGDVAVKQAGKVRQEVTGETMYYLYLGPKDSKNRPFCEVRVNKALTQEAADSMTGTQERYNCRHNLVPVTQEYVKKEKIPIYQGAGMSRNRGRITQRGRHVTWKGETKVNVKAVEAIFKTEIVKMILLRTFQKSRDKRGVSFPGYSTKYKEKRQRMGEAIDRVYLHLTGGLQRSITWLNVIPRKDRHTVTFGAKPTRSRQVTTMANGGTGHYRETGKWGPRHNELLYYLGPGAPSNKRRDIMGLTKSERAEIARQIKNTSGVLKVDSIVTRGG